MASKKMDKLKQAGAGMDKFFSGASESVSESPEKVKRTNTQPAKEKPSEEPQKSQKKVFSFRAEVETIEKWKIWANAKGLKVEELGVNAISEYIKKHKLTDEEQQIYDLKVSQKLKSMQ